MNPSIPIHSLTFNLEGFRSYLHCAIRSTHMLNIVSKLDMLISKYLEIQKSPCYSELDDHVASDSVDSLPNKHFT